MYTNLPETICFFCGTTDIPLTIVKARGLILLKEDYQTMHYKERDHVSH